MAAKGKKMSETFKHDDWLLEQLKDAEFAAEYLTAASEYDDPKTYLTALGKVVEARGGMACVEKSLISLVRGCTANSRFVVIQR
jgi:DNA-binding phage protein